MSATATLVGAGGFTGSSVTEWCTTCEDYAVPMKDGTCGFCGELLGPAPATAGPPTPLGDRPQPPPRFPLQEAQPPAVPTQRDRERRVPLRVGQEGFGPVCHCGGRKAKQAHECVTCFKASGRAGGAGTPRPQMRGPYGVSEDQMVEARRVYEEEQVSLREIARRIFPETYGYANERSLSEVLYKAFRNRGWPLRSKSDATRLRNWKHGLKTRTQSNEERIAYRRWLAEQRGWNALQGPGRPKCKGIRKNSPGRGKPCTKNALMDSDYCFAHDPARAAERGEHLARIRAKQSPEERERILAAARAAQAESARRRRERKAAAA